MFCDAAVGEQSQYEQQSQQEQDEASLEPRQLLPFSPAGLPSVFAIVVVLTVWVTECQRDEVLSGRRVHPLIGVDGRMS